MKPFVTLAVALPWLLFGCATTSTTVPEEITQWLEAHNRYRSLHHALPIIWSDSLAAGAQSVADSCPSGHSKTQYGENLAWVTTNKPPQFIVQLWYEEVQQYDFQAADFSPRTGHFTQVVWKGTSEIGCGHRNDCSGKFSNVWVCHYNPPGNILDHFGENVLPR